MKAFPIEIGKQCQREMPIGERLGEVDVRGATVCRGRWLAALNYFLPTAAR